LSPLADALNVKVVSIVPISGLTVKKAVGAVFGFSFLQPKKSRNSMPVIRIYLISRAS
jgi:hypothetical protein